MSDNYVTLFIDLWEPLPSIKTVRKVSHEYTPDPIPVISGFWSTCYVTVAEGKDTEKTAKQDMISRVRFLANKEIEHLSSIIRQMDRLEVEVNAER